MKLRASRLAASKRLGLKSKASMERDTSSTSMMSMPALDSSTRWFTRCGRASDTSSNATESPANTSGTKRRKAVSDQPMARPGSDRLSFWRKRTNSSQRTTNSSGITGRP